MLLSKYLESISRSTDDHEMMQLPKSTYPE